MNAIPDDIGSHDSLTAAALSALPEDVQIRWLTDCKEFNGRLRTMLATARRGVLVAPIYRKPLAQQYGIEAERRAACGDPTAVAWAAQAESAGLAEQVAAWEPEFCR